MGVTASQTETRSLQKHDQKDDENSSCAVQSVSRNYFK